MPVDRNHHADDTHGAANTGTVRSWSPTPIIIFDRSATYRNYLLGVWLTGLLVVLVPIAVGFTANSRLLRHSERVTDGPSLQLIANLSGLFGLTRTVTIFESSRSVVPMTWGVLRPVVLLPQGWRDWTENQRRCVLLHELAHVHRFDVFFQLIARIAAGFHWFNPLVWYGLRELRVERELACDDCVIESGERASDYARELLLSVKHCHPRRLAIGVAIASSARLDQRVLAILDETKSRLPISKEMTRGLILIASVLVTSIVVIRPVVPTADETQRVFTEGERQKLTDTKPRNLAAAARVLRLPVDRTLGVVYVQDQGKDVRESRERLAYARGDVRVPLGKQVRLDVSTAARQDLSPLRRLSPDSLQMLAIREAELDDEALANIRHLTGLRSVLLYCCRIDDLSLKHLANLSDLETLDLRGSTIGDDGISQLVALESLTDLDLGATSVTDKGMVQVAKLKSLKALRLASTDVSDSGLAYLQDLSSLESLDLSSMKFISNAGLAHLARLTKLGHLDLSYSELANEPLGDAGLTHIVGLKDLKRLLLLRTRVTDSGLIHLQALSSLEELWLPGGISDAGLERVGALSSLRTLAMGTVATDQGLSHLAQLENLEYLSLACDKPGVTDRAITHFRKMKRLKSLGLHRSEITDQSLLALGQLQSLEDLRLHNNRITFEGLKHLEQFASLNSLSLSGLKGGSATLRYLQGLKNLKSLTIGHNHQLGINGIGTDESDEGLAYLTGLTKLEFLSLNYLAITDEGMKHLSGLKSLKALHLNNNKNTISDTGLEHLADMKNLESLFVRGSLTDHGLEHLAELESLRTASIRGRPSGTISHAAINNLTEWLPSLTLVYNLWTSRARS